MAEEPSLIQAFPQGLQGILGLKGQGFPHALLNEVNLNVDALELYLLGTQEAFRLTGVVSALGPNTFAETVPLGELWYVWMFTIASQLAAGEAIRFAPQYNFNGVAFAQKDPSSYVALERPRVNSELTPFWAWQSGIFGFESVSQTLTPTVSGNLLISRVRV